MKTMKIWRLAFAMLAAFSLASCSEKHEVLKQETNFGVATINGKAYRDYVTVAEALSNKFFYTPLNGSGKFLISNGSVAYLQFVLRDDSASEIHESWLVLVGISIPEGEDFPVIGKEYPIQYSPLTDHTFSGGGNFYELKLLEQMKATKSADIPSGVGGLKIPYAIDFITLSGSLSFSNATPSKDGTKVNYSGQYTLENQPDEENGKISINGKFNLTLE